MASVVVVDEVVVVDAVVVVAAVVVVEADVGGAAVVVVAAVVTVGGAVIGLDVVAVGGIVVAGPGLVLVGLVGGSSAVVESSAGWVVVAPGRGRMLPGMVVLAAWVVVGARFRGDTVVATIIGIGIGGSDATIVVVVPTGDGSDDVLVRPTRSTTENES